MISFVVCLLPLRFKLLKGRDLYLFGSLMYSMCFKKVPACIRHPVNICWINAECMNAAKSLVEDLPEITILIEGRDLC